MVKGAGHRPRPRPSPRLHSSPPFFRARTPFFPMPCNASPVKVFREKLGRRGRVKPWAERFPP